MKDKIRELPSSPGVYLMKDSLGGILYVGKSKNLKKRVQSYFYQSKSHPPKIKKLVSHVRDLEHRVTDTEFEAFMLECRLIHELKPMYNRKMKNPLGYTYVNISLEKGTRRIQVTNEPSDSGDYASFGPYTSSKNTVEQHIRGFLECFRIDCCHSGAIGSACLNVALGKCIGICRGGEAADDYNLLIDRMIALLNGADLSLYDEMVKRMEEAAERFDFEEAARYRDTMKSFDFLMRQEQVIGFAEANRKVAVMERIGDKTAKLFLVRRHQVIFSGLLDLSDPDGLRRQVKSILLAMLEQAAGSETPGEIGREEIDEARIIYSYLSGGGANHLVIPDDWLAHGGDEAIDEALAFFLQAVLAKEDTGKS